MKLASDFRINEKLYKKGDEIPGYFIYPLFLFHIGAFGFLLSMGAYRGELDSYLSLNLAGIFTVGI